jgi:hypothetical protein
MSRLGLALAIVVAATSAARAEEPTRAHVNDGARANDPAATSVPANDPAATSAPANDPAATSVPANDPAATSVPANDGSPTSTLANDGSPTSAPANDGSPSRASEPTYEPASVPATEAATLPASEPATEAATLPATEPATEAATLPATEPATEAATLPASEPATAGANLTSSSRRLNRLHEDVACRDCTYHAPPDLKDQAIGASLGMVTGGRVTPGGLRIEGHYLYQLAASDWFDGTAAFTLGGGSAACFRDRANEFMCDHGLASGKGVEITAAVRHFFSGQRGVSPRKFWPFVRAGVGIAIDRFSDDDVTGVAIPLHAGAGMRTTLTRQVALIVLADLQLGIGRFNHSLGWEPQVGAVISAGVEFGL